MINYFSVKELSCKCCGTYNFNELTLKRLNQLRYELGHPIFINSGYRCKAYNDKIGATQTHASGQAVDIKIRGSKAHKMIAKAIEIGFTGIGVNQKGANRYVHIDDLQGSDDIYRPTIWSY